MTLPELTIKQMEANRARMRELRRQTPYGRVRYEVMRRKVTYSSLAKALQIYDLGDPDTLQGETLQRLVEVFGLYDIEWLLEGDKEYLMAEKIEKALMNVLRKIG